jgi:hypothetical protein
MACLASTPGRRANPPRVPRAGRAFAACWHVASGGGSSARRTAASDNDRERRSHPQRADRWRPAGVDRVDDLGAVAALKMDRGGSVRPGRLDHAGEVPRDRRRWRNERSNDGCRPSPRHAPRMRCEGLPAPATGRTHACNVRSTIDDVDEGREFSRQAAVPLVSHAPGFVAALLEAASAFGTRH